MTIDELAQQFAALQGLLEGFGHQFLGPSYDENTLQLENIVSTIGNEALTVDIENTPGAGEVWILSRVTLQGVCTIAPPTNIASPITGLFLVRYGAPKESLAEGQAAGGWNIESRGIALPAGVVAGITTIGTTFAFNISLTQSAPIVIGPGQTVRGVVSCNPGTAAPGPGASSWGRLIAMGVRHQQRRM